MFGGNTIAGKKYFNEATEAQAGKLLVTSMFVTLQGEGPLRGEPAFFIRLAKCNLACSFCDTYFDQGEWLSIDEISEKANTLISTFFKGDVPSWAQLILGACLSEPPTDGTFAVNMGDRDGANQKWLTQTKKRKMALVVTGGEPTLQANLYNLLAWGEQQFWKTQIESNGILVANLPNSTILVISPKCNEIAGTYIKPHPHNLKTADCLKFVMEAGQEYILADLNRRLEDVLGNELLSSFGAELSIEDLSEKISVESLKPTSPYASIPDWALEWKEKTGKPVFISPMNIYRQEPQKSKDLRARTTETTIEERSLYDEVISFWEEGLLDMAANKINHEYAANFAIRNGCIFGVQIHLLASVA